MAAHLALPPVLAPQVGLGRCEANDVLRVSTGRWQQEQHGLWVVQGEAEREVVRVVLECCLQERSWNPYYAHLLASLTRAVKGHRITLQFCLWDHFKQARPHSLCAIVSAYGLQVSLYL